VPEPTQIVWSDEPNANVEHVAQHGVTPEEADEVICEYYDQRQRSRSHQHRWVVQGYTSAGRYLGCGLRDHRRDRRDLADHRLRAGELA